MQVRYKRNAARRAREIQIVSCQRLAEIVHSYVCENAITTPLAFAPTSGEVRVRTCSLRSLTAPRPAGWHELG